MSVLLAVLIFGAAPGLCCCAFGEQPVEPTSCCSEPSTPKTPVQEEDDCGCHLAMSPVEQAVKDSAVVVVDGSTRDMTTVSNVALPVALTAATLRPVIASPPSGHLRAQSLLAQHSLLTT